MGESNICVAETILVTADTVVCRSPAILFDVTLTGKGDSVWCGLYDGENTNGKKKVFLEAKDETISRFNPGVGVRINNGIYVDVSASEGNVMVTFLPLERHE